MTVLEFIKLILHALSALLGAYVCVNITYNAWLLAVAAASKVVSRSSPSPPRPSTRFCLLIPAHNEELVIGQTLEALAHIEYAPNLVNVIVIADNCTDNTVSIARAFRGVTVLERTDNERRGKGYALNWAIKQLAMNDRIDAFAIVDADTHVDAGFFREMDARRFYSRSKFFVAQGRYDVLNPEGNWRTALMAGALSLVHVVRPTAREFLHLSVGLKGNGMCFDREVFSKLSWRGDSLTEDLEYTLDLLEQLDTRVQFVPTAIVAAYMPTNNSGAGSQRKRWENGRSTLVRKRSWLLLYKGFSQLKPTLIDAAIDLFSLPLAELVVALGAWWIAIGFIALINGSCFDQAIAASAATIILLAYVIFGFAIGEAPSLAFKALLYAPYYVAWKIMLLIKDTSKSGVVWIRTEREQKAIAQVKK